ncbi:MAG: DUF4326 domain-containing protein [Kiloniellales bacterium]
MSQARPTRIQVKRSKGWRLPAHAVYVGRPSRWGNPFVVGRDGDREACKERHRAWIMAPEQAALRAEARAELRGKTLACWCRPDQACHADTLLEIANAPERP